MYKNILFNKRIWGSRFLYLGFIFSSLFILSSCVDEEPEIICDEGYNLVDNKCILIEINGIYSFSQEVSMNEQKIFIENNERLLIYLIDNTVIEDIMPTYYISDYDVNFINRNTDVISLNVNAYDSTETILLTLMYINSDTANYGLMYGFAQHIAEELNYESHLIIHTSEDMLEFFFKDSNIDYLDITYPCFVEEYATEEQIEYAYDFFVVLVDYIIDDYGVLYLDYLIKIDDDYDEFEFAFVSAKNTWISSVGSSQTLSPNEHPIYFSHNLGTKQLIWKTNHATWYLEKEYDNLFSSVILPDNFLMSDYQFLCETIMRFESEFSRLDTILRDDNTLYPELIINITGGNHKSNYYSQGTIDVYIIIFLSHEYVHYLGFEYFERIEWLEEAVAFYYSFDDYYNELINIYYIETEEDHGSFGENFKLAKDIFEEKYNRELDYQQDKLIFNDIYIFITDDYDDVVGVYNIYSTYEYVSFINYFINTYGEDVFHEICVDTYLLEEYTSKTWEEIIFDWETYIKDTYS